MKSKIINDPVHGFIEIPKGILLDLIDTDVFQRLRRIQQLALSSLVYPGALHSRFNHALGALHLTRQALEVLQSKGIEITPEEKEATLCAILLHDVGHGPFSHALESVIIPGLHHEAMSKALMHHLNQRMEGGLELALQIFEGEYEKFFLHQLVSSQLDMDRLDYLVRDSYFTGVVEGRVSVDRIIKTLNVADNRLVVESKGIYSVEKFIVARRLMYWQVYLHKAVISAEFMIVNILKRARSLFLSGKDIWMNDVLVYFMRLSEIPEEGISDETLFQYIQLDDQDILYGVKQWARSTDFVLSTLCKNVLRRKLLKTTLGDEPIDKGTFKKEMEFWMDRLDLSKEEASSFVFSGKVTNSAYLKGTDDRIFILQKNGELEDLATASDMRSIGALSNEVKRYYLSRPGSDKFFVFND